MNPFVADHRGNGRLQAGKRGPGRPPKPVDPPEAFTAEHFRLAMEQADQIDEQTSHATWHAEWGRRGMHAQAFKLVRKLKKQGPAAALAFHEAYLRYLELAGVLER